MRIAFIWTISIAILLSFLEVKRLVRPTKVSFTKSLRRVLLAAISAEFACLFMAVSVNALEAELSYALYYASFDWIVFFLIVFARDYIKANGKRSWKIHIGLCLILTIVDTLQIFASVFTHHAFSVYRSAWKYAGGIYYMAETYFPYMIHLAFTYLSIVVFLAILIKQSITSVSFYRIKYIAILVIVVALAILNGAYLFLKIPLDWSVILYSAATFLLEYYSTKYAPQVLKINALSQTVFRLGEGLIIFDINEECIYANAAIREMFGLDADSIKLDEAPVKEWLRGKTLKDAYPIDTYYDIDSNRELIRYRLQLKQIVSDNGDYIGSYFQVEDVTQEYRSMMELKESRMKEERARIEASRANRAKSDFLANMSHEIRTPINAVLGMNEMILREDVSPEVKEYARNIANSGEALLSIINDILDFSKIESGKMELHLATYEPYAIIRSCETMIAPRISNKNLSLIVECDENCPSKLFGDEVRIRQVLTNILTNAAKYTEKGSVTLKLRWESKRSKDGMLILSVSDTGIGITRENQTKLFDAFQRIEERRNRNIEGTGLGLSITSQLVKLMNGVIDVDSEYGKGSTFTIRIPQSVMDDTPSGVYGKVKSEAATKYTELFKAPEARILAVDDYKMNLTVLKGLLKKTEVKLTLATSGMEALEKAENEKFHLILMDHMMPGMDGIETLEKIRKGDGANKETPVIMLTANAISGVEEQYLKAGFQGYLSKPINSKALEEELLKYIPEELII